LYQGDELGLPEADIEFEDLQDPYGIEMWPNLKGRDGCRTPMPWNSTAPSAGFSSSARPWLPVAKPQLSLAVDQQQSNVDSLLHFYTQLLHWRRTVPALVVGTMQLLPVHPQVLAFVRESGGQRVLCLFNFSDQPAVMNLPSEMGVATPIQQSGLQGATLQQGAVHCAPWGGLFAALT
jgi:alpha-glucosidase